MAMKEYIEGQLPDSEWENYALAFAQKIVERDFLKAFEMLAREHQKEYGIVGLEARAMRLIHEQHVPMQNPPWILWSSTDWADKKQSDLGIAYIHVGGDFNEALTPTVLIEDGALRVGEISWHRP